MSARAWRISSTASSRSLLLSPLRYRTNSLSTHFCYSIFRAFLTFFLPFSLLCAGCGPAAPTFPPPPSAAHQAAVREYNEDRDLYELAAMHRGRFAALHHDGSLYLLDTATGGLWRYSSGWEYAASPVLPVPQKPRPEK